MTAEAEIVRDAAMALSGEDRDELIVALLAAKPSELSPEWLAEINRRSDGFERGQRSPKSWDEVRNTARSASIADL